MDRTTIVTSSKIIIIQYINKLKSSEWQTGCLLSLVQPALSPVDSNMGKRINCEHYNIFLKNRGCKQHTRGVLTHSVLER